MTVGMKTKRSSETTTSREGRIGLWNEMNKFGIDRRWVEIIWRHFCSAVSILWLKTAMMFTYMHTNIKLKCYVIIWSVCTYLLLKFYINTFVLNYVKPVYYEITNKNNTWIIILCALLINICCCQILELWCYQWIFFISRSVGLWIFSALYKISFWIHQSKCYACNTFVSRCWTLIV